MNNIKGDSDRNQQQEIQPENTDKEWQAKQGQQSERHTEQQAEHELQTDQDPNGKPNQQADRKKRIMQKQQLVRKNRTKQQKKSHKANETQSISEYASALITDGAIIDFVFYEDFNADGDEEAVVGFTRFTPFPPDSEILYISKTPGGIEHKWLSDTIRDTSSECGRINDNAAASDTDGDGRPELVVSQVIGNDHEIRIFVFDWKDDGVHLAWRSANSFFHGSMETSDIDDDGTDEIIIESGTHLGNEIIDMQDACYHVRKGFTYKWNGKHYEESVNQVRMPYGSYNIAVDFIRAIWLKNYSMAYEMAVMPGFLGLSGLDDSSLAAFKSHIIKKVRPALMRNLSKGKLSPSEPYDTCCQFVGAEDCFTVELIRAKNEIRVYGLEIAKRNLL